jgi:pyridoxal phosphate enzyme (YggS family)
VNDIASNLAAVRARVARAARSAGRDPAAVTLVAVSKTQPPEAIRAAYAAGQRDFGENYAQELRDKARDLADLEQLRWHFVGHLQTNKARIVAPHAALVESVDSARLADELSRLAAARGARIPCLVQVNVGEEGQKSGCAPADAAAVIDAVERADGLELAGLMTLPPYELDAGATRLHFRALRALRDAHGGAARLPQLSMGMSHDFEEAIAEGATIVRVGTAIFGGRGL